MYVNEVIRQVRTILNDEISPTLLVGGVSSTTVPATWAAISDGSFKIDLNGTVTSITAVDFTGDATMANVATSLQTRIQAVTSDGETFAWDAVKARFTITPDTTDSIGFITSDTTGTDISGATYLNGVDRGGAYLTEQTSTVRESNLTLIRWVEAAEREVHKRKPDATFTSAGVQVPVALDDLGDVLLASDNYLATFVHYVLWMVFVQDAEDTLNLQRANQHLQAFALGLR